MRNQLQFSFQNARFRGNSVFVYVQSRANSAKFECLLQNMLKTRVFGVTAFFGFDGRVLCSNWSLHRSMQSSFRALSSSRTVCQPTDDPQKLDCMLRWRLRFANERAENMRSNFAFVYVKSRVNSVKMQCLAVRTHSECVFSG